MITENFLKIKKNNSFYFILLNKYSFYFLFLLYSSWIYEIFHLIALYLLHNKYKINFIFKCKSQPLKTKFFSFRVLKNWFFNKSRILSYTNSYYFKNLFFYKYRFLNFFFYSHLRLTKTNQKTSNKKSQKATNRINITRSVDKFFFLDNNFFYLTGLLISPFSHAYKMKIYDDLYLWDFLKLKKTFKKGRLLNFFFSRKKKKSRKVLSFLKKKKNRLYFKKLFFSNFLFFKNFSINTLNFIFCFYWAKIKKTSNRIKWKNKPYSFFFNKDLKKKSSFKLKKLIFFFKKSRKLHIFFKRYNWKWKKNKSYLQKNINYKVFKWFMLKKSYGFKRFFKTKKMYLISQSKKLNKFTNNSYLKLTALKKNNFFLINPRFDKFRNFTYFWKLHNITNFLQFFRRARFFFLIKKLIIFFLKYRTKAYFFKKKKTQFFFIKKWFSLKKKNLKRNSISFLFWYLNFPTLIKKKKFFFSKKKLIKNSNKKKTQFSMIRVNNKNGGLVYKAYLLKKKSYCKKSINTTNPTFVFKHKRKYGFNLLKFYNSHSFFFNNSFFYDFANIQSLDEDDKQINAFNMIKIFTKTRSSMRLSSVGFLLKTQFFGLIDLCNNHMHQLKKKLFSFAIKNAIPNYIIKKYFKNKFIRFPFLFTIFSKTKLNDYLNFSQLSVNDLRFTNYYTPAATPLSLNTGLVKFLRFPPANPKSTKLVKFQKFIISHKNTQEPIIRRVKFKPGYSILWRKARTVLQRDMGTKFRYQHRLTKFLIKFYKFKYLNFFFFKEIELRNVLIKSKFLPEVYQIELFFENKLIFLNGVICSNWSIVIMVNDFIQFVVSYKYYILYKWLLESFLATQIRFKNKIKVKMEKKQAAPLYKQKSTSLPNWVFINRISVNDSPDYLEIDYFTLSFIMLYDPFLWTDVDYLFFLETRWTPLNMYNWKYLN